MSEQSVRVEAVEVLARYGYATTGLGLVGAGQQSVCYGTRQVAVLLSRADVGEHVADPMGRILLVGGGAGSGNGYAVLQWMAERAVGVGCGRLGFSPWVKSLARTR